MGKFFTRENTLEVAISGDNQTLTFPFSSEFPVDRGVGIEILDHSPTAPDFSRCQGAPFLWNHNRDAVLGVIEKVWLSNRRGYCQVRWSRSDQAQKFLQDVKDGILTNVSCGYSVEQTRENYPDRGSYLVTRWTPREISLVSIPADPTVGVGRSFANIERISGGSTMTFSSSEQIRAEERDRVQAIRGLISRLGHEELGEKLIEEGVSIEVAREAFLERVTGKQSPVSAPVEALGLSSREERQYSLIRAINACVTGNWKNARFERECSEEISKRSGREPKGFFVPVKDLFVRDTYAVGAPETGGYTVSTDLLSQNFIDLLRNKALVMRLGATMLSGLRGNVAIPKRVSATTTYWVGESGEITQSEGTFSQLTMTPKTIAAKSQISRLTLLQSSLDIEQLVREDFAREIALGIDKAALVGTGLNNQPTGILNTSGIGSVSLGTNGGAPTWASLVNLCKEIEIDNADVDSMKWLTNPRVKAKLMTTPKQSSGVEGNFIMGDPGSSLLGYSFYTTNQMPANLTKGTGTDLSSLILGNWRDLLIGEWGVVEILPNPYGDGYSTGDIELRIMQTVDVAIRRAESFAAITDMITT